MAKIILSKNLVSFVGRQFELISRVCEEDPGRTDVKSKKKTTPSVLSKLFKVSFIDDDENVCVEIKDEIIFELAAAYMDSVLKVTKVIIAVKNLGLFKDAVASMETMTNTIDSIIGNKRKDKIPSKVSLTGLTDEEAKEVIAVVERAKRAHVEKKAQNASA